MAAIPIPAPAPGERTVDDEEDDSELSAGGVRLLVGVISVEGGLVSEVVAVFSVEDVEVDCCRVLVWVETTAPSPLRTIPRFSKQQRGSLSQQKLPSSHSTARGKNPVPGSVGSDQFGNTKQEKG